MDARKIQIIVEAKDAAGKVLGNVAGDLDAVDSSGKKAKGTLEQVTDSMKVASGVLIGAGAGLTLYAKKSNDFMVGMVQDSKALARQTGDTIENTSRLQYVMNRMGLEGGTVSTVFNTLSKRIVEANEQTGEAALKQAQLTNKIEAAQIEVRKLTEEKLKDGDATGALTNKIETLQLSVQGYQRDLQEATSPLQKLNIETKNADGSARSFNDILFSVADKFKAMPDGVDKTNAALEIFGRSGGDMVKVLNLGSDGIKEMMDHADKLGLTITSKNITAVNEYIKSNRELKETHDSLKMAIGTLTAPIMTGFNKELNKLLQNLVGTDSPYRDLIANTVAFGGPVATAAGSALALAANLASALPLLDMFGKKGKKGGNDTAEGLAAAAGGARLLPLLFNPVTATIAAVAATAGIGYVAWKKYNESTKEAKRNLEEMTPVGEGNRTSMTFMEIATNKQRIAQEKLSAATQTVRLAVDAHKVSLDNQKAAQDGVNQAQTNVQTALTTFGNNSPQYQDAVNKLADSQRNLNDKIWDEFAARLQLQGNQSEEEKRRAALKQATDELAGTQIALNGALNGTLGVIATFGPTANAQLQPIATLQGAIQKVVTGWNATNVTIQTQAPNIIGKLQGIDSTIQRVQNNANTVQRSVNSMQLTGNVQNARGFAAGTDSVPVTGEYLVGERGPERVNLPAGAQVSSARDTERARGDQVTVNYQGPFYFQTGEAVKQFFDLQNENSALAAMGMSVMRPVHA